MLTDLPPSKACCQRVATQLPASRHYSNPAYMLS